MAKTNSGLLEFKDDQKVLIALDDATSEVKKAVIIAADGTETDIAGGGGGVTVEALSVTENGTYSEEGKAYSPVTVNVAGGTSDFSTAEVTVSNGTANNIILSMICIKNGELGTGITIDQQSLSGPTVETVEVVLYQGSSFAGFMETTGGSPVENYSLSGNIVDEEGLLIVTGNGTIAIGTPA